MIFTENLLIIELHNFHGRFYWKKIVRQISLKAIQKNNFHCWFQWKTFLQMISLKNFSLLILSAKIRKQILMLISKKANHACKKNIVSTAETIFWRERGIKTIDTASQKKLRLYLLRWLQGKNKSNQYKICAFPIQNTSFLKKFDSE